MRKEKLLEKKQAAIQDAPWYVKMIMDDSDLKQFSVAQIELLCQIMARAEEKRETCFPFYTLSENEVLQKSTNRIAYFENSGEIREESEEEVLSGAASEIYKLYIKKQS